MVQGSLDFCSADLVIQASGALCLSAWLLASTAERSVPILYLRKSETSNTLFVKEMRIQKGMVALLRMHDVL